MGIGCNLITIIMMMLMLMMMMMMIIIIIIIIIISSSSSSSSSSSVCKIRFLTSIYADSRFLITEQLRELDEFDDSDCWRTAKYDDNDTR